MYAVSYQFKCVAHKSKLLDEALNSGEFVGMELIGHTHHNLDSDGNFQVQGQSLNVKAGPKTKKVTGLLVRKALRLFKQEHPESNFDEVRVNYKQEGVPAQTARLSMNELDEVFTRKEWITLDPPVEQQQTVLNPTIVA